MEHVNDAAFPRSVEHSMASSTKPSLQSIRDTDNTMTL
jgi:hypothetical protein